MIGQDNCDGDSALATVTEIGVQVAALYRNTYTQAVPKTTDKGGFVSIFLG